MKPLHFLLAATLIAVGSVAWLSRQVSEAESLRAELASLRRERIRQFNPAHRADAPHDSEKEAAFLQQQIANLRAELTREQANASAAEEAIEEVRQKLPSVAEGETIISLGRISDMGKEAASAIRGMTAVYRGSAESIKDQQEIQANFMKLIGRMPEIAGFEERPSEMASFQAAVFRELFDLDESRTRQVESIIRAHFEALQSSRLTAANSGQPTWKERRMAALTPLMWQLKPFMPQGFETPELLGQIVNMGAGLETKTATHFSKEPGKSVHTVSMALPSWPRPPWLLPKENASK